MTIKNIWGHIQREWGYEIRVDFQDDNNQIFNEIMTFKKEPSQVELDNRIAEIKARLEFVSPEPSLDIQVICEDGMICQL